LAYEITVSQFSGPLDLLLHLIQKQELDIYDIPIAQVTEQYMAYLQAMEELSLEIASEFIVMAATLLALKSRMLLPRKTVVADEQEEFVDPREELVQQLLEYQRCKWAAEQLKYREAMQAQVFSREPMDLRPFASTDVVRVEGVTMWDLVDAFRKLYLRVPKTERVAEITGHVIRVEDMMDALVERLRRFKRTTFDRLLDMARSRPEVVSAFLALLELMKDGIVHCLQSSTFGVIEIELYEESDHDRVIDQPT
jgi:segregation and condensation protein A